MGEKFSYTAGLATRKEFEDAPGMHLNREERGDVMMLNKVLWLLPMTRQRPPLSPILRCHTTERCQVTTGTLIGTKILIFC